MNKILLVFWFLIAAPAFAQDSSAVAKSASAKFSEKDVMVDKEPLSVGTHFKPGFKKKYDTDDFRYEVKVDEKSTWERFKEWLAYWFKKIFGLSNMEVSSKYVEYTLKGLAVIIVCYVIYLIAKIVLNKEGQWVFGKSTTRKIYTDEEIERNLIHVDFEKLIRETMDSGNNRLAIRYYYLWVLKKLSERNFIEWHAEKTNSDYLYEISSPGLKEDFKYLSYLYNYIWYGEFEITETTFLNAKNAFERTLKTISR